MRSTRSLRRAFLAAALFGACSAGAAHAASTSAGAIVPGFGLAGEDFGDTDAAVVLDLPAGAFEASAQVGYGALTGSAHYQVDEFSRSLAFGSTIASASAQALDRLTITGGSGAGTLLLTFSLDAFGFESDPGIVWGQYSFYANTQDVSYVRTRSLHGLLVGELVREPIPFVFGEPFSLSLGLTVSIEQLQDADPPPFRPLVASLDYGAAWTGSAVFDAEGDPVAGFAIAAESGSLYPAPEPGAGAQALASGAALTVARRRSARRRRSRAAV